jgi:hypothetical protein
MFYSSFYAENGSGRSSDLGSSYPTENGRLSSQGSMKMELYLHSPIHLDGMEKLGLISKCRIL